MNAFQLWLDLTIPIIHMEFGTPNVGRQEPAMGFPAKLVRVPERWHQVLAQKYLNKISTYT